MTEFMGKILENPLIASSCIATENVKNVLRLAENGVQGAVLKSCADYERGDFSGKREFARDTETGFVYASSPFQAEIFTLSECLDLMAQLRPKTDILLIPSFTAKNLKIESWLPACRILENSGADGIQLDFFYMGNLIGQENFSENLSFLLKKLRKNVNIPIMPKLNINLPKNFIMSLLAESGIEYVSLLDSVRSPYIRSDKGGNFILDGRLDPETTSCFGSWQLPLTLSYACTAVKYGLKVCAGGGITCADDVKKLLALGVETVQSASFLTRYPNRAKSLIA